MKDEEQCAVYTTQEECKLSSGSDSQLATNTDTNWLTITTIGTRNGARLLSTEWTVVQLAVIGISATMHGRQNTTSIPINTPIAKRRLNPQYVTQPHGSRHRSSMARFDLVCRLIRVSGSRKGPHPAASEALRVQRGKELRTEIRETFLWKREPYIRVYTHRQTSANTYYHLYDKSIQLKPSEQSSIAVFVLAYCQHFTDS